MKIQELERKTGLERPSIRFYEKEGLLNPERLENGYREYSEEDVELLKKIKLLRRLGMSIEKIRELQQGSEDLAIAISRQAGYHTSQIDDHRRCRAVCEAIHDDGAAFSTLDAEHYLTLLREIRIDNRALGKTDFQEKVPPEIHPWRRYFARCLDYFVWYALIRFILIVPMRLRPLPGDLMNTMLTIGMTALFIPLEAILLHKFGTTPGKWIMGIRLEYLHGGNLPFSEAIQRSYSVFIKGMGLGIPFAQTGLAIIRYCQLTGRSWRRFARYDEVDGPQDMPWDEVTEFIYESRSPKRGVAAGLLLAVSLLLISGTVIDGMKPKYRGNQLTVAQIAENYNTTLAAIYDEGAQFDKLQPDGTKEPVPPNTLVVDPNSSVTNQQMQFEYDVRDGMVRSVSVHHEWDQVFYLSPLDGEPMWMAMSLLLAQDGCGIREMIEFTGIYESHLNEKNVSFIYRNLLIEWRINTELDLHQGVLFGQSEENVPAILEFRVTLR